MKRLELHFPISAPITTTQAFGVNGEYYRANGINILDHNGYDFKTYHGQPIFAPHDGYATYFIDDKNGHGIELRSTEKAAMLGLECFYKTVYIHLCDYAKEPQYASPVKNDKKEYFIKQGELLGYADNTGLSSGDHLHFGLKPIAQDSKGKWYNIRQSNGYLGAIDPGFYFTKFFVKDFLALQNEVASAEPILVHIQELPAKERAGPLADLGSFLKNIIEKYFG